VRCQHNSEAGRSPTNVDGIRPPETQSSSERSATAFSNSAIA
jgi:hypothetical protein